MRRRITTLREERASIWEQMKALSDQAAAEGRDLSAEEYEQYGRLESDLDARGSEVERLEKESGIADGLSRSLHREQDEQPVERSRGEAVELRERAERGDKQASRLYTQTDEYRDAFEVWMRNPNQSTDGPRLDADQRAALAVGTGNLGGFTVPKEFYNQLIVSEREFGVIRQLATVITTAGSGTIDIPAASSTRATAAWTAEAAAYTESEDTFAQVQMGAFKAAVIAKLSEEIIHDSAFDVLGWVARSSGEALGVLENTAYAVGTSGSTTTPEGLNVKATAGVTLSTGQTTTVTDFASELVNLYHSLLSPYRPRASWLMNDATIKVIRKLKTGVSGDNTFLWQPGLQAGQPDTILGRPVFADPDIPVQAANAKFITFGDIRSAYMIRDVEGVTAQPLNELYAANGQVGFRVHKRTDGDIVDTLAVKNLVASAT